MALIQVLFRTFQALRLLWPLAWTAGAGILLNVALVPVLTALIGFPGLPLSSTLSAFAGLGFMVLGLRERAPARGRALASRASAAVVLAGVAGGVAAWLAREVAGDSGAFALAAGVTAGIVGYASMLTVLAPGEARAALAIVVPAWGGRAA